MRSTRDEKRTTDLARIEGNLFRVLIMIGTGIFLFIRFLKLHPVRAEVEMR